MTSTSKFSALVAASIALTATPALAADPSVCEDDYSMTDVDGNGYISKIEMNAYAENSAAAMDTDKSGTVSRDEYVNCSLAMMDKPAQSAERTEDDMARLDANDDGKITQEEFLEAGAGTHAAIQTGDQDAIDRTERLILVVEGEPQVQVSELALEEFMARSGMLFARLDRDADSALTREEFMNKAPEPVDISEVLNREFDAADTDNSGDLTQTELIAANARRAEGAMQDSEQATGQKSDPELGAPVVYYTFPVFIR